MADAVVTNRLDGALPSIAYGKKIFYFGTRDTRTMILDDLGILIHPYRRFGQEVRRASATVNRDVV